MAKIESVSVCIARVPLDNAVTFSTRTVTAREYCLIKVRSVDGVEGIGYCYAVNTSGRLLSVAVTDLLGARVVGQALFSDQSQITLRMLTRGDAPADLGLWRKRLQAAIAFRESLELDATAYRLVHAEADLLPSLIVDRYADGTAQWRCRARGACDSRAKQRGGTATT